MSGKGKALRIVGKESYAAQEVKVPTKMVEQFLVEVPWILRDESISVVRWPRKELRSVPVLVPELSYDGKEIVYIEQQWAEETIVYTAARIRGQLIEYQTELWQAVRVRYVQSHLSIRRTYWVPEIELRPSELSVWERASIAILGGARQEINEIYAAYDEGQNLKEVKVRAGTQSQYEGLGQLVPTVIRKLNIGNNSSAIM